MGRSEETPLFKQLATACPRTGIKIENPAKGGFDILWVKNWGKLKLDRHPFPESAESGLPESFISESPNPKLFAEEGQKLNDPAILIMTNQNLGNKR